MIWWLADFPHARGLFSTQSSVDREPMEIFKDRDDVVMLLCSAQDPGSSLEYGAMCNYGHGHRENPVHGEIYST
jgi:hypothetical protein